ncbi:helix-turn-helix domain-containing protein [Leucobacter sp. CSA1]|uniref:Helix-turn-helix domain-containing protein n=1 Tax=Leucobacter chromiisoli TaxID=2796471 RepID=A0A934Q9K2_9MICO|nr:helix-turn-helix transcriptional regulator [Leucobacter chromiisoli]MBK0419671.1 helix-turn-helix domain-containing protein [Leucobacter chromiisoli]
MRPVHPAAESGPIRIGAKLRASRLAQGLTLERVAAAAGVTKGFLSRIERDGTSPSVSTLVQICQALSLPVGSLFEAPEVQRIALAGAPRINMGGTGVDERLITPRGEDRVQTIRSSLEPGGSGGGGLYTVNCDVEVLHVISGSVLLRFAEREEHLGAGDTLTFPGRTPHNWYAGDEGAEVMWTLIPAPWSGSN